MPERKRDITVHLAWSQLDAPLVPIPPDARLYLSVHSAQSDGADPPNSSPASSVSILGNSAGLVTLAEHLLAIAHSEIEDYQQHFNADAPENFLNVDGNWELVLGHRAIG